MSKKKEEVRNYNISDGLLKQTGDDLVGSARRDIAEMSTRGVTTPDLDILESELNDFADIPTDEELLGDIGTATEEKDNARDVLDTAVNTIRTMAENKWGLKSAKYRKYSFGTMSQLSDEKFFRLAKRVHRVATGQLADLASEGLTQTNLDDLSAAITAFDTAIDVKNDAEKDRDNAAEDRIEAGNAIYKKLTRISRIGKDIWYETSESKYNDYVFEHLTGGGGGQVFEDITIAPGAAYTNTKPDDSQVFSADIIVGTGDAQVCTVPDETSACAGNTYIIENGTPFEGPFSDMNISGGGPIVRITNLGTDEMVIRVGIIE